MTTAPKLQEEYSAKIPALTLLANLGWTYLSPQQANDARGGKLDEVVLKDVLRDVLSTRQFVHAGTSYTLSKKSVDNLITQLCRPALNQGLLHANETLYNHLCYGITVTEFVDGKKVHATIPLIDWDNPTENKLHVTDEFSVKRIGRKDCRRPDIVLFVNGLPLVVIEAKRPDSHKHDHRPTIEEGISQSLRNQKNDEIPHLFVYSQLLLAINSIEGRYATTGTPMKFWATWREEDFDDDDMERIKNGPLSAEQINAIFGHRPEHYRRWYEELLGGGALALTDQDRMVISLLDPARLLDMVRYFTLFDKKVGKIVARYQQVFGIKRLIERISIKRPDGGRQGGVIWHTTGSGKSFTMVFLSKSLIFHDALKSCRLLVVTDRVDLENQLSSTFASGGELASKKDRLSAMATSGKRLAEQIGKGDERIMFSLIQKFNTATKLPECHNDSADMIVLIDEGHRSQNGENHTRMRQALPNASFVAFTGTPLLKDDKTTNKFGPIVHAYTMQRAVEDRTVTPLLYEERKPELDVNDRGIDSWFERITRSLTEEQKLDLKRKYSQKGHIYHSDDRIHLIALDIANHFDQNITEGLKGQLATDSKSAAIKYKEYLDEANLFESAVIMSPPDSREGHTSVEEEDTPEVVRWWKDNVGTLDEQIYTKQMIERFNDERDPLTMLIVVDKLLTGFDAPNNTVLYIDKPLKEHNLIQAIARVNRLHEKKEFGLLIDYRGILSELDTTIEKYQDLAAHTQGGYDINDLEGLYNQMSTEYKRLPGLYKKLWAVFDGVKNKRDFEQLRQVLIPRMEESESGDMVDVNLKNREDFYEALGAFSTCLKVALQSVSFFEDSSFTEEDRIHYKETIKQFSNLRQLVKQDAGETVSYDQYEESIKRLLDKHVVGIGIAEPEGVYEVGKMGQSQDPEEWSTEKVRNETDLIKTRLTRTIEQELQDDPYAKEQFSKLLRQAIEEAEALFDHPLKQFMLFREFEEKVKNREVDDIPKALVGHVYPQAIYGIFKLELSRFFGEQSEISEQEWVELAFETEHIINRAKRTHSVKLDNIEAQVRRELLPMMFKTCHDMGPVKNVVERVVQMMRAGA